MCSQGAVTEPYPRPVQSSTNPPTYRILIASALILPSHLRTGFRQELVHMCLCVFDHPNNICGRAQIVNLFIMQFLILLLLTPRRSRNSFQHSDLKGPESMHSPSGEAPSVTPLQINAPVFIYFPSKCNEVSLSCSNYIR